MSVPHSDAWLTHIAPRLQMAGFEPLAPQTYQPAGFKFAVRRTRFEFTKFGMAEAFFVFADLPKLTLPMLSNFSAAAFQFAINSKTVPLPCGFFEAVFCFPVAITSGLDPQLAEWIRQTEPPKHFAACEMPVAFDTTANSLAYFERTAIWGAAYFAGCRHEIRTLLG
jgi:hypothetical protein